MSYRFTLATAASLAGLLAVSPPSAVGQISSIRIIEVNNSAAGAELSGFVTCTLRIGFAGPFTGAQLLLNLESGSVYRSPNGNANGAAPNPGFFGLVPALEFDSYFGNPTADVSAGAGAVDLGGAPAAQWPATTTSAPFTLNQAWNPPGGLAPVDQTGFETFRLTLSDDAHGTYSFLASANGQLFRMDAVVISGLGICIPEPTTALTLGAAGLALVGRRRLNRDNRG